MTEKKTMMMKPFIQSYLEYLQENHPQELEVSISMVESTDLRMPHDWFPEARKMKRKIIFHHGPTNSGKTFSALNDLENSKTGIYCSPLRLLAWEIQRRLEDKKIPCSLITGQESVLKGDAGHMSCTIESINMQNKYDTAVIDEIQMIADGERGSAWTTALLGLQANTIHLCGESRALSLVSKLCEITGDTLEERVYERYSRLHVEDKPFQYNDLKEGDCMIAFSVKSCHQTKRKIEAASLGSKNSCAIIYGMLPPETKKNQALKFNDPNCNTKYLVATNAIGMGINLKIRRIIFQSLWRKGLEKSQDRIPDNEIKQIAGRAGRHTEAGYVTATNERDLETLQKVLRDMNKNVRKDPSIAGPVRQQIIVKGKEETPEVVPEKPTQGKSKWLIKKKPTNEEKRIFTSEEKQIGKAVLFPQYSQIEPVFMAFKQLGEGWKLSDILKEFIGAAAFHDIYEIQNYNSFCLIADFLERVGLSLKDHYTFSCIPLKWNSMTTQSAVKQFALTYIYGQEVLLPNIFESANKLFSKTEYDSKDLLLAQDMYHILEVYLWLGQKYPNSFVETEKAQTIKENIVEIIDRLVDLVEPVQIRKPEEAAGEAFSDESDSEDIEEDETETEEK